MGDTRTAAKVFPACESAPSSPPTSLLRWRSRGPLEPAGFTTQKLPFRSPTAGDKERYFLTHSQGPEWLAAFDPGGKSNGRTKMKPTDRSVTALLDGISDETRRKECYALVDMMKRVTRTEPRIWGSGLVGFGNYHYKYESGHEGDCFVTGFASRKTALTLYITAGVERFPKLIAKLGKHKAGKGCLYIKKLDDVNLTVLEDLVSQSVEWTKTKYQP